MELITAEKIDQLESAMCASPNHLPAEAFPLFHHLTGAGLYARELVMPAGTIVTVKAKKESYITVLSAGAMVEVTVHGTRKVKAPYTWVSEPGVKRVLRAYTDCVIVTIHQTTKTTLPEIEAEILVEV